jgi:hypothetical protein
VDHTSLTTCPVRPTLSLHQPHVQSHHYQISPSTCGTHITAQFVESIQYTSSYHPRLEHILLTTSPLHRLVLLYNRSNHPTVQKNNSDRISFKSSPVTVLDPTITCEWHNTNYMSSMSSPITIPDPTTHIWNTTLTTCPICPVLSLC